MFGKVKMNKEMYRCIQFLIIHELDNLYRHIKWIDESNNEKNYHEYVEKLNKLEIVIEFFKEIYKIDDFYYRKDTKQYKDFQGRRKIIEELVNMIKTALENIHRHVNTKR